MLLKNIIIIIIFFIFCFDVPADNESYKSNHADIKSFFSSGLEETSETQSTPGSPKACTKSSSSNSPRLVPSKPISLNLSIRSSEQEPYRGQCINITYMLNNTNSRNLSSIDFQHKIPLFLTNISSINCNISNYSICFYKNNINASETAIFGFNATISRPSQKTGSCVSSQISDRS